MLRKFTEVNRESVWFQTTWACLHFVGACMNLGSVIFHLIAADKYRKIGKLPPPKGKMGFRHD